MTPTTTTTTAFRRTFGSLTATAASRGTFGSLHFGNAALGDVRRTARLVRSADLIIKNPGGTLPNKIPNPYDLDAFYALMNRPETTHCTVLEPHRQLTLERMRAILEPVLVIHDGTELDYTGLTSLTGLGQIGNGNCRGYICHNSLAVRPRDRTAIGLVNQILARRDDVPKNESRQAKRARETRESRLWLRGSEAVGAPPPDALWVDVCDRGADTFEFLDYKHRTDGYYIVRSNHDRFCEWLADGVPVRRDLHAAARQLEPLGCKTLDVAATEGQPARRALLTIAAAPIRLFPPRNPRGEHGTEPLSTNVVIVREPEAPAGAEPVEWILLVNLPSGDLAEASRTVDWYGCRPIVEELHKGMKTGCGIETLQFTTEEALQPAIAMLSVTAVFLLSLRDAGRDPETMDCPAADFFPLVYVEVLSSWRHGTPREDWTVGDFYLALGRLGGHQNRPSDGPPGWLVLWRGWTRLQTMLDGAAIAARMGSRAEDPDERSPPVAGSNTGGDGGLRDR
jgi:hypothetical protein